jgi:energy-coupling factor transport system substrate-specific component
MAAGALSGFSAAVHDVVLYYPAVGVPLQAAFTAFTVASGALVAGVGAWLLLRALVRTGVLAEFEAGRGQERI